MVDELTTDRYSEQEQKEFLARIDTVLRDIFANRPEEVSQLLNMKIRPKIRENTEESIAIDTPE